MKIESRSTHPVHGESARKTFLELHSKKKMEKTKTKMAPS